MDRISELPDFIIHHILSFLGNSGRNAATHLVRMSVLSKKWFDFMSSFPILDFNMYYFRHTQREYFFKYVEYTTSRFCHQNLIAHEFKLITDLQEPAEVDIVNRCLELVLQKGVRLMEINLSEYPFASSNPKLPKYHLPKILLSVSMLRCLTMCGCELPSSLMVDHVKFNSLIMLTLENVAIDDEAIEYLTANCPLLRDFSVSNCHGFKRFSVYRHQNLQGLLLNNTQVERIDIEARNLSFLTIVDLNKNGPPQMNVTSCKKLTKVTYNGRNLQNTNGFTNFLSNFPFVRELILDTNIKSNNLKLSSDSLRSLMLNSNFDLEEIELSTPNMGLFIYSSKSFNLWPMVIHLYHLKARSMRCYLDGSIDTLWFRKLRLFLDKENGFKALNLYIHTNQKFIVLEKTKRIEFPLYELKHVELHLDIHDDHTDFVDALLWCFRPRSLTLRSSHILTDIDKQSDVVKFAYEKLLQQEDERRTKIQIVSPFYSNDQKHFKGLIPLMSNLPCEGQAIRFIKEQVIQDEAE